MAHAALVFQALGRGDKRREPGFIAKDQELRLLMAFSGDIKPIDNRLGGVISPHGIDGKYIAAAHCALYPGIAAAQFCLLLDPDDALGFLAGANNFTVVVMAAMGADMVRALQLTAIGAFSMGLGAQSLMAAAHASARRGGFSFRNGHNGYASKNYSQSDSRARRSRARAVSQAV
jgi:hypothetical protein